MNKPCYDVCYDVICTVLILHTMSLRCMCIYIYMYVKVHGLALAYVEKCTNGDGFQLQITAQDDVSLRSLPHSPERGSFGLSYKNEYIYKYSSGYHKRVIILQCKAVYIYIHYLSNYSNHNPS